MSADLNENRVARCDESHSATDDSVVRLLLESGDLGVRPGRPYPSFLGDSEKAQLWRAVMGDSEEQQLYGFERQSQRTSQDRYILKRRRRPRSHSHSPNERLIGAGQFCEAYSAVAYANSNGAVLNTQVTVSWGLLGYEEDEQASATLQSGFIKHLREWFRHMRDPVGRPFAWIYAHERSEAIGLHTHFFVFIPSEWRPDFDKWLAARMKRLNRLPSLSPKAWHVTPKRDDRELEHQWRRFGYLMKSVDPRARISVFPGSFTTMPLSDLVEWACEGPGEVRCRLRVGIAHELRAAARVRAQYRSLLECGVTDRRLLFADYDYQGWVWAQAEARYAAMAPSAEAALGALGVDSARRRGDDEFEARLNTSQAEVAAFDRYCRESGQVNAVISERLQALFRA